MSDIGDADALGKSGHGTPSPSLPTPGPWTIAEAQLHICARDTTSGDGRDIKFVAHVAHVHSTPEEARANARLIAAAPDLLAALTACVEWQARVFDSESPCWDAARAVIAKATGQP